MKTRADPKKTKRVCHLNQEGRQGMKRGTLLFSFHILWNRTFSSVVNWCLLMSALIWVLFTSDKPQALCCVFARCGHDQLSFQIISVFPMNCANVRIFVMVTCGEFYPGRLHLSCILLSGDTSGPNEQSVCHEVVCL